MTRDRGKGIEPDEALAAAVRQAIATDGEAAVLERLKMSPQTVARIGSRLPVIKANVELARLRMGLGGRDG